MFNSHIKFEMSTISCKEEMKGNAKRKKNSPFEPHFGGLRGNVHGSSIARWKAPILNFPWVLIEFFSLALMSAALFSEICYNRRILKGWVTLNAIFGRWGRRAQSIYGSLDKGMMLL